ncbi:MAG: hypothetical protein GWP36_03435 [Bacteroidetes bacterium]|nr:hypothetical protein [Bacteroidota bacterium]
MYMRGIRVTYTNEMMKNSVVSFMSGQVDLTEGMIISFRCHLSKNQILHVMVFPDEEAANSFERSAKVYSDQIKDMSAKIEIMRGDISHFGIAGDVTLDQLRSE